MKQYGNDEHEQRIIDRIILLQKFMRNMAWHRFSKFVENNRNKDNNMTVVESSVKRVTQK